MSHDPQWYEQRKAGLGGSDMAAVLGLSPWRSPLDVWKDKTGKSEPTPDNPKMEWGRLLEDLVARKWAEVTGKKVRRVNQIIRHNTLPFLANIDRAAHDDGAMPVVGGEFRTEDVLECKTASEYTKSQWGEELSDEIPIYYLPQCLHYIGLCGESVKRCHVAVLIGGSDFRRYIVNRDDEVIGRMWDTAGKWWRDYVVTNTPPPPRTMEEAVSLYPRHTAEKIITATAEIEQDIARLSTVKSEISALEETEKELKDRISCYLGSNEAIADLQGRTLISWKASKDTQKTDYKAAASEMSLLLGKDGEAVLNRHTGMVPGSRRMLIKSIKGE